MMEGFNNWPQRMKATADVLKTGVSNGLHFSGQITVSHRGQSVLDHAFGRRPDTATLATTSDSYVWMSSGKPITAVAIARLVDRGELDWHMPVSDIIPEFANRGKEAITLGHILSQSAALRNADAVDAADVPSMLKVIYELPLEPGGVPGEYAGYHVGGTWMILGEVLHRVTGLSSPDALNELVLAPLAMHRSGLGGDADAATIWDTTRVPACVHPIYGVSRAVQLPRPGRNMHGPVCELAMFYTALVEVLQRRSEFLKLSTLMAMIQPQRPEGLRDRTFGHQADFGYGFYLHPDRYGEGKSSYGYGRHASWSSFGHSGAQSSCAFHDPEAELVVAWVLDGMPGEPKHQRRARALNEAIYSDLGLDHVGR